MDNKPPATKWDMDNKLHPTKWDNDDKPRPLLPNEIMDNKQPPTIYIYI